MYSSLQNPCPKCWKTAVACEIVTYHWGLFDRCLGWWDQLWPRGLAHSKGHACAASREKWLYTEQTCNNNKDNNNNKSWVPCTVLFHYVLSDCRGLNFTCAGQTGMWWISDQKGCQEGCCSTSHDTPPLTWTHTHTLHPWFEKPDRPYY